MNPRTRLAVALLATVALLVGGLATAPAALAAVTPDPGKGAVFGVVTHDDDPRAAWTNQWSVVLSSIEIGGPTYTTTPAVDGSYSFTAAVPGRYGLSFRYTGNGPWVSEVWVPTSSMNAPPGKFAITAGSVTEANGAIPVGGTLSGHLSRADGSALISPTLYFSGPNRSGATFVNSTTGDWMLWGLYPGAWRISFDDSGMVHEYWSDVVTSAATTPIVLGYGQIVSELNTVLDAWSTISGTVTKRLADGTVVAAPAVGIQLSPTVGIDLRSDFSTYTDSNGRFLLRYVPSGDYFISFNGAFGGEAWQYWGGGQTAPASIPVGKDEDVTGIDITLDVGGRLTGRIDNHYSTPWGPLSGGSLFPERLNPSTGEFEMVTVSPPTQYPSMAATYSDGTFDLGSMPAGTYRLAVTEGVYSGRRMWWPGVWQADLAQTFEVRIGQTTPLSPFAMSVEPLGFDRLGGSNRFGTIVETSRKAFPGAGPIGVPVVYLANGFSFPDALGAGPAAVHLGGALLTVTPTSIPAEVRVELLRLAPQKIVVVGGQAMVSDAVIAELKRVIPSAGGNVVRVAGANRYETSREIVREAFLGDGPDAPGATTAFIATGRNFPDALAAGPAASVENGPVILVDGAASGLDVETRALLIELHVSRVYILGGTGSVSGPIETGLRRSFDVERFAGSSRYETAQLIAARFFPSATTTFIATGKNFPDALGGGAVAGKLGAPLMLTVPTCVLPIVAQTMRDRDAAHGYILGGTGVLTRAVEAGVICTSPG